MTGKRPLLRLAPFVAVLLLMSAAVSSASTSATASTPLRSWTAQIGDYPSFGANGSALLTLEPDGTGTLSLNLRRLLRGTTYPLELFLGRWMAPGTSWAGRGDGCRDAKLTDSIRLPSQRTTAAGTIVRTLHLTRVQMVTLNKTARRLALSAGTGRIARCGSLLLHLPQPVGSGVSTPSSSPTPAPSPPPCSPWPDSIPELTAGLSTPPSLCLRIYTDPQTAPEFVFDAGAIYFPDPPTASYLLGTKKPLGDELHVLLHELCHAHQDEVSQEAKWTPYFSYWYATQPGWAYVQLTGWQNWIDHWVPTSPAPWGISYSSPIEENADLCAFWFDPRKGPSWVKSIAPDQFAWAERWLPQPVFPTLPATPSPMSAQ